MIAQKDPNFHLFVSSNFLLRKMLGKTATFSTRLPIASNGWHPVASQATPET